MATPRSTPPHAILISPQTVRNNHVDITVTEPKTQIRIEDYDGTVTITLTKKNAGVTVTGVYNLAHTTKILTIFQHHAAAHTKSTVAISALLADDARLTVNGTIAIPPDGAGADASFTAHALIVGKRAHAVITPFLEIEPHDVRARHAVTVTRPAAEELAYMASRGLSEEHATALVAQGFLRHHA